VAVRLRVEGPTGSNGFWMSVCLQRFFPAGFLDMVESVGYDRGLLNGICMMMHNCLILSGDSAEKASALVSEYLSTHSSHPCHLASRRCHPL